MTVADALRRCLIDLDVDSVRRIWGQAAPGLPAPANDGEALTGLHMARTAAQSVPFRLRAYSHAWLAERGFPSLLPDPLRTRADRLYPKIVEAVGISVNFRMPELRPAGQLIGCAMSAAVEDIYADNPHPDAGLVSRRMAEARHVESRKLFGRWAPAK